MVFTGENQGISGSVRDWRKVGSESGARKFGILRGGESGGSRQLLSKRLADDVLSPLVWLMVVPGSVGSVCCLAGRLEGDFH